MSLLTEDDLIGVAQKIRDKFASVPTFDALIETLRSAGGSGIKGTRKDACRCPIANWLNLDPEIAAAEVEVDDTIYLPLDSAYESDTQDLRTIRLPVPFSQFIDQFDAGLLPEFDRNADAEG